MKRNKVLYAMAKGISEYCARQATCDKCIFWGKNHNCAFDECPEDWMETEHEDEDEDWFERW